MNTFQLIELAAVVASGVFGSLLARRKQMDFVGVFTIAFAGGALLARELVTGLEREWVRGRCFRTRSKPSRERRVAQ